MGHLGESVGKELLCGLWAGFLVKCFTQLVVLAFLWRLSRACSTVLLAVPCGTPGFFWIVWEKVGLFGPVPLSWESQALTHTLLPAPASKTTGKEVSLGTEPCHYGWRVTRQSELVPLILFNLHPILDLFHTPKVCWNFSARLLDFYKCSLIHGLLFNQMFFDWKC